MEDRIHIYIEKNTYNGPKIISSSSLYNIYILIPTTGPFLYIYLLAQHCRNSPESGEFMGPQKQWISNQGIGFWCSLFYDVIFKLLRSHMLHYKNCCARHSHTPKKCVNQRDQESLLTLALALEIFETMIVTVMEENRLGVESATKNTRRIHHIQTCIVFSTKRFKLLVFKKRVFFHKTVEKECKSAVTRNLNNQENET